MEVVKILGAVLLLNSALICFTITVDRGLPLHDNVRSDNRGNAFCIAFLQNGINPLLRLYITTNEPVDIVHFQVTFHNREAINNSVSNNTVAIIELPSDLALSPSSITRNGISIRTMNPYHLIVVTGFSDNNDSSDAFLAIPITTYPDISLYQYAQFSVEPLNTNQYSMFALVNCGDDAVVPLLQSPTSLSGLVPVRDVYRLFFDSRETVEDRPTPLRMMEQYDSLHFESNSLDLSGIIAWADRPFSFIAGHTCGQVDSQNEGCDHMIQQIPPSYTWGYTFYSFPLALQEFGYLIKVVPRYNGTVLSYNCEDIFSEITLNDTVLLSLEPFSVDIEFQLACSITTNRPVGIVQISKGDIGDTAMVWLVPVNQYINNVFFYSGFSTFTFGEFANVIVPVDSFNPQMITLDNSLLQSDENEWTEIYCYPEDSIVCAYGINVTLSNGSHIIAHNNPSGRLTAVVYGWGDQKGYMYPAGFALDPIGVPIISFSETQYVGSEDINPVITLTRGGDVFVDIDIIVEVFTLQAPQSPTPDDFVSLIETAHFGVGQTEANVSILVRDDLRVESDENFTLILKPDGSNKDVIFLPLRQSLLVLTDNDQLIMGFTESQLTVSEDSNEVDLILRSNIPLQDSGVLIRVFTEANTASDLESPDFVRLNDPLSLQPGEDEWIITVELVNDGRVEVEETFYVEFVVVTATVEVTTDISRVQINITDEDTVTVHFIMSQLSFPESGVAEVRLLKDGQSDLPIYVLINSEDGVAMGGSDYGVLINNSVIFESNETEKILTVTIIEDSILESEEDFRLRLSLDEIEDVNPVIFDRGSEVIIIIEDDDDITIGFSLPEFPEDESNEFVIVTVEVKTGMAERSFKFHVETFEQQAEAGSDFQPVDTDLTFPSNQSSFDFNITFINNNIAESSSEGFTVSLTNSPDDIIHVRIDTASQITTIVIKEDDIVLVRMNNLVFEGKEGGDDVMITLTKSGPTAVVAVSVLVSVAGGSATENEDFTIPNEIVTFAPEETTQVFSITILPDSMLEDPETIRLILFAFGGPVEIDLNQVAVVTIQDEDVISIQFSDETYSVVEGEQVTALLVIAGSINSSVTVSVSTSFDSANEMDFTSLDSQIFVISPETMEFPITIQTKSDNTLESDESFFVSFNIIEDNNGLVLGSRTSALVTINDNDEVIVSLERDSVVVSESDGSLSLTVQKLGEADVDIIMMLTAEPNSAKEGRDYSGESHVFTITPQDSSVNVNINITDDSNVEEKEEMFRLLLEFTQMTHDRVIIGQINYTDIFIQDDDVLHVLFDSMTYETGEDLGIVEVRIITSGITDILLNVTITTLSGSALANEDFIPLSDQFFFSNTQTDHVVPIAIRDDLIFEGLQVFYVELNTTSAQVLLTDETRIALIQIRDGDTSGVIAVISPEEQEVFESDLMVTFMIIVLGIRQTNVQILFYTKDGSAKSTSDYNTTVLSLEFLPNETMSSVVVNILNDDNSEIDEEFVGMIESNNSAITLFDDTSIVVIKDDEGIALSFEDIMYHVSEGNTTILTVLRSVVITEMVQLQISVLEGDAEESLDYKPVPDILVFAPGETSKSIIIEAVVDGLLEQEEENFQIRLSLFEQFGAVINMDTATVTITDEDVLILTGNNVIVPEQNGTAQVCFQSSIPTSISIQLELTYLPSLTTNSATDGSDYNATQDTITIVPTSQPASSCVTISIIQDQEIEPIEHFCVSVFDPLGRIQVNISNMTEYCTSSAIAVTIIDSGITTQPLCHLEDSMVITPFPKPTSPSPAYSYHGSCEHVLTTQCGLSSIFTINADHNPDNLELSRIGIRLNQSFIVVMIADDIKFSVDNLGDPVIRGDNQSFMYGDSVQIETDSNERSNSLTIYLISLRISMILTRDLFNLTSTLIINATEYSRELGELCGLCGTLDGELVYSDAMTRLNFRTLNSIEDFARSWLVTPENQITRENRRECGALGNDSIVGDPLFSVPLYLSDARQRQISLCFEIHGSVNKVFNLVSDRCVSVNALYVSMNNPDDGNVITSIGIKAVNNRGHCVNIVISLAEQCIPAIDLQQFMYYNKYGISVMKHDGRVSVSAPNCENEQLVMWILCRTIAGQEMIDFTITRGLNLRPTSHGLIGQFWNIPVNVTSYQAEIPDLIKDDYDSEKLYLVTVSNPLSITGTRQFIGELSRRSWNRSLRPCLYVGSSQGGQLTDIPGPRDSVIEGVYTEYCVSDGILGVEYMYSQFDRFFC